MVNTYDPTYRIGVLPAANQLIVSVKPDDELTTAVTKMLTNDYSQLPVMRAERDLKGIISWASIGSRMALKQPCEWVRDCMNTHVQKVPASSPLFSVITTIVEHDYVLVIGNDNKITGIVTASDLSLQFQKVAGPFLLLREIEQHVRNLIDIKLTVEDLQLERNQADRRKMCQ
jgi:predicted transcriptional regulator